ARSRGNRHWHFARDPFADDPQPSSGQGSDGTPSTFTAAGAVRFHFHPQPFARKGNGTFTPKKRWDDQRLRSRNCGDERASFRNRPTGSGNGSMFAGKSGVGHHAIGSGIGADRNRGVVAHVSGE